MGLRADFSDFGNPKCPNLNIDQNHMMHRPKIVWGHFCRKEPQKTYRHVFFDIPTPLERFTTGFMKTEMELGLFFSPVSENGVRFFSPTSHIISQSVIFVNTFGGCRVKCSPTKVTLVIILFHAFSETQTDTK